MIRKNIKQNPNAPFTHMGERYKQKGREGQGNSKTRKRDKEQMKL